MKLTIKKILLISALVLFTVVPFAHAVCPVCTVAVGAGLGLAEWLGIDDSISGLWIGALVVSMSIWTINWLNKRKTKSLTLRNSDSGAVGREKSNFGEKKRPIRDSVIFLFYYLIVLGPLWLKGKIGHPYNRLCGIDKLLLGIILGTVLFSAGVIFHNYLKKKNENKSYLKGQKIVAAVLPLIIASIILYFTC